MNGAVMLNCYWVLPGRFLAGEYPGGSDRREARRRLGWLLSQGVTWFLDLTQPGEYGLPAYDDILQNEAGNQGRQTVYLHLSIPDYGTPSREEMQRIQETLQEALDAGHTVYVHCYGGVGRTGTVVGCYLRRQGFDGLAALGEIARLRQGLSKGMQPSPETETQRQMIVTWEVEPDERTNR